MSSVTVSIAEKEAQASLSYMREMLADLGGCDHSVGICLCHLVYLIDYLEDKIAQSYLTEDEQRELAERFKETESPDDSSFEEIKDECPTRKADKASADEGR